MFRSVVARHGRRALASPMQRTWMRTVSNDHQPVDFNFDELPPMAGVSTPVNESNVDEVLGAMAEMPTGMTPVEKYRERQFVKTRTAQLGSEIEEYYKPSDLVSNPPSPADITLELLMASQAHMGHATSLWNPANQRYIYGVRQGIHIISLETTAAYLRRAAKVVEGVAYHGGLILFVGTRPGQHGAVVKAAKLAKGCHLFEKWVPGTLTNGSHILAICRKKVVDEHDQRQEGYEEALEKFGPLKPDLVVCLNPLENYICLHECGLAGIPTIGIIDTDANPTWVTYPIPANDDSLRCTQLIAGVLGRAGEQGHKKRLQAAKDGVVTWQRPASLQGPKVDPEAEELEAEKLKETPSPDGTS